MNNRNFKPHLVGKIDRSVFLFRALYLKKNAMPRKPSKKNHGSHSRSHSRSHSHHHHGHKYVRRRSHCRGLNDFYDVGYGRNYYPYAFTNTFANAQANAYVDAQATAYANVYTNAYANAFANAYGGPYNNVVYLPPNRPLVGLVTPNQVYYQTNPYALGFRPLNDCLDCGSDLSYNPVCTNCG